MMISVPRRATIAAMVLALVLTVIGPTHKVDAFKKEKLGLAFLAGHLLGGNKHAFVNVNTQPQVLPYPIPWPVGGGGGHGQVEHIYKTTHVHHVYGRRPQPTVW